MLPKAHRIPKEQIKRVLSTGKRIFSSIGMLHFVSRDCLPSRFAIVIGKSVSPKATKRNRSKRLVRQSVIRYMNRLLVPVDLLIIIKKPLFTMSQQEANSILEEGLQKAGLLGPVSQSMTHTE